MKKEKELTAYQTTLAEVPSKNEGAWWVITAPFLLLSLGPKMEIIKYNIDNEWARKQIIRYVDGKIKEKELKTMFEDKGFFIYGHRKVKKKVNELINKGFIKKGYHIKHEENIKNLKNK